MSNIFLSMWMKILLCAYVTFGSFTYPILNRQLFVYGRSHTRQHQSPPAISVSAPLNHCLQSSATAGLNKIAGQILCRPSLFSFSLLPYPSTLLTSTKSSYDVQHVPHISVFLYLFHVIRVF